MKKFFYSLLAAVTVVLAACGPENNGQNDANLNKFKIEIEDVTANSAKATITPVDANIYYYLGVKKTEEFAQMKTEHFEMFFQLVLENFTYPEGLFKGQAVTEMIDLIPNTDYVIYVVQMKEGYAMEGEVEWYAFRTSEAAVPEVVPEGAITGHFTVDVNKKVYFSRGNLQCIRQYNPPLHGQASSYTNEWRFAEHQWEYFGNSQSDTQMDIFGFGTGEAPTSSHHFPFVDWGDNPIANGGNEAKQWRTLTIYEWMYLFIHRPNADKLFALGSVNGLNGVIILPDNWVLPAGVSFVASTTKGLNFLSSNNYYYNINEGANNYSDNTYTADQWAIMEAAGAVFLPAAGVQLEGQWYSINTAGYYWSASDDNAEYPSNLWFRAYQVYPDDDEQADYRMSVRLVQDVK